MKIFVNTSGQVNVLVVAAGVEVVNNTSTYALDDETWHHVEVAENGNTWYVFVNGVLRYLFAEASRPGTYTGPIWIGYDGTNYLDGEIDEYRISSSARHTSGFTSPTSAYSTTTSVAHVKVGSTRPLKGIRLTPETENTATAAVTGTTWTGSAWSALTIISDGTSTGGMTLAKEGTIAFASTDGTSKPVYQEGYFLYWYWLTFTGIDSAVTISYATVDAPFQGIKDIWDGVYRGCASLYKYTTLRTDNTLNVYEETYDSTDAATYSDISSLPAGTQYLEIGFTEQMAAILFDVAPGYVNTTANTLVSIDYWNGSTYVSIGTITDGTAEGGVSLAKTGVMSWTNAALTSERKMAIAGGYPLYYYRVKWDQAMDATVRIYYVAGITAPRDIDGFSFPIHCADRMALGCDNYGHKNKLILSAENSPDVYNGSDYYEIKFGDDKALTCGAAIFAQYASNIYNLALLFKANETWILHWAQVSGETVWSRYKISPIVGCPGPRTLRTASVAFDKNPNATKVVAIWRANNGIYISNGQAPLCVSQDIKTVFEQSATTHANPDMINYEYSFINQDKHEYHWLWASGTAETLNKEYVLDLNRWKWFEIDRATGNYLQCGVAVADTLGNQYAYGILNTGYMERLEYGTTFDVGTAITCTLQVGDQVPIPQDILSETRIARVDLIAVAKNTDSTVTLTHYLDGATTGTDYTLSMADATHRYANDIEDIHSNPAIFHSFKLVTASSSETKGMEPLYMALYYQKERDHTR